MKSNKFFTLLATIIALGMPAFSAQTGTPKEKVAVIPGATLALPADCKVNVRWVCPPLDEKVVKESYLYDLDFAVDNTGQPWLGYGLNKILSPTKQYKFVLSKFYEGIACLENGAFLVATSNDLGFIIPPATPEENYEKLPVVHFQPIADLPIPNCKLFAGAGDCLYLVGSNPTTGENEVYLLRQEKSKVREYVKIFSTKDEIYSVAGDGEKTYVAVGRLILKILSTDKSVAKVFLHPREGIKGLVFNSQFGLIYATYSEIGYIGSNGNTLIMTAKDSEIRLQKGSLYVLFRDSLGILALDNIVDLKRYNLAIKEVPATQSNEVKVKSVRFFEAGEEAPDYASRQYATKFARVSARYVYCQLDMDNLLKGKKEHKQKVTMELYWPGKAGWISYEEINFNCTTDLADLWGWARFGSATAGTFYPGEYTVKTYLNGAKIDERRFTISGELTVADAAALQDNAKLKKLLESEADPNITDAYGKTALMYAVESGVAENVRLLLEHKADVNAKDSEGYTALLSAAFWYDNNSAIMSLLLKHGADVNAKDKDGQTALHKAARTNNLENVKLLLEHKADPNVQDNEQCTPLMRLTYMLPGTKFQAKPELVELFINHGADVNAKDKNGEDVLRMAVGGPDLEIVKVLVVHGANLNTVYHWDDGTQYSLMNNALASFSNESDRLQKEILRKIIRLLCENKAALLSDEQKNVLAWGWDAPLTRDYIKAIIEQNDQAVFSYSPKDTGLRRLVLERTIKIAYNNIVSATSTEWFTAALEVCLSAKSKAESWGMLAQYPEICYNCSILYTKLGNPSEAETCLNQYLELAPNGKVDAAIDSLLDGQ